MCESSSLVGEVGRGSRHADLDCFRSARLRSMAEARGETLIRPRDLHPGPPPQGAGRSGAVANCPKGNTRKRLHDATRDKNPRSHCGAPERELLSAPLLVRTSRSANWGVAKR